MARTAIESATADARHAVGNGHRGQTATTFESIPADFRHAVSFVNIGDRFWNRHFTSVHMACFFECHRYRSSICVAFIINAVDFKVIGTCLCAYQTAEAEKNDFCVMLFHFE